MSDTTRVQVGDLTGVALDWAVAGLDPRCQGLEFGLVDGVMCGYYFSDDGGRQVRSIAVFLVGPAFLRQMQAREALGLRDARPYCPTSDWNQAGRLIESEKIGIEHGGEAFDAWIARVKPCLPDVDEWVGETPLVAALRCLVATKLGPEVDVPNEILSDLRAAPAPSLRPPAAEHPLRPISFQPSEHAP